MDDLEKTTGDKIAEALKYQRLHDMDEMTEKDLGELTDFLFDNHEFSLGIEIIKVYTLRQIECQLEEIQLEFMKIRDKLPEY